MATKICKWMDEWDEVHPYGSTTARETLIECGYNGDIAIPNDIFEPEWDPDKCVETCPAFEEAPPEPDYP